MASRRMSRRAASGGTSAAPTTSQRPSRHAAGVEPAHIRRGSRRWPALAAHGSGRPLRPVRIAVAQAHQPAQPLREPKVQVPAIEH